MKNWLCEHKKAIILSTVGTLLPILVGLILWNRLPDSMPIHWGVDGAADGAGGKAFAVFGIPAIMASLNLLAFVATAADPKQQGQNRKAMGMVFWILPLISWVVCCAMYAFSMGKAVDVFLLVPLLLAVLFVVIGNFLPKVKQNSTLGIKIAWTLCNEENWNKTHRLAGKLWVAGGVTILLSLLLPNGWIMAIMLADLLVMVLVPVLYSYSIYKKHKAQGIDYAVPPKTKEQKIGGVILAVILVVIAAGLAVLMFTGQIRYNFGADSLQIEATYAESLVIPYEDMESIELRQTFDVGAKTWGFSSAKLSLGAFQNEELATYTIYAYNACDSVILIRSGEKCLVINAETAEQTQNLYASLLQKAGKSQ